MRSLDANLLTAQQAATREPAIKITLSFTGKDDVVLECDRLYEISPHEEQPYRQSAEVLLYNGDGYFTEKDLKGYKAVISYGLVTKAGKKYSPTPPLWVLAQELTSAPRARKLLCELKLVGIPNLLAEDRASTSYIPEETDTKTIKTLLTEIITATLACYSHCPAYEVVFDSEDDLIDTYQPKDSFRIYTNGSRLAAIRRLIDHTHCMPLFKADGKIHILKPVTTGEVYDYEHSLKSGHAFFSKIYRKTLVIPNYIVVQSQEGDTPQYSGYAKDPSYDSLPTELKKHQTERCRLESDQQATDIAEAILGKYQLNAEMGSADVPMNCGAELFDYDKVTDELEEDYRVGNIGAITRTYKAEKRIYDMRFSFGGWLNTRGLWSNLETYETGFGSLKSSQFEKLYAKDGYIENLSIDQINAIWLDPDSNIDLSQIGDTIDSLPDGEVYARVKSLHLDAGLIKLDEYILYKAGYNPTEKMPGDADLDDIPDGVTYKRTKSVALTAGGLVILDQVVIGTYGLVKNTDISAGHIILSSCEGTIDNITDGITYSKVLKTSISAGKIILSEGIDDPTHRLTSDTEKTTWNGKEVAIHRGTTAPADTSKLWLDTSTTPYVWKRWSGVAWVKATPTKADEIAETAYLKWAAEHGADVTAGKPLSVLTNRTLDFISDSTYRKAVTGNEKLGASDGYDVFRSKLTAYGLSLWTANSSTRVELTSQGLRGYYGGALQVELRASDGKIYAGAGAVILDASGLKAAGVVTLDSLGAHIKGKYLEFQDSGGTKRGYIWGDTDGELHLAPYDLTKYISVYKLRPETSGGIILRTVAVAEGGSLKWDGDGGIYVHDGSTWRHIT